MTTLRSHIADVLLAVDSEDLCLFPEEADVFTAALLADPTLKAIIDLAAHWIAPVTEPMPKLKQPVIGLLRNWRASRAEQEPER